ncbi:MAG: PDDEXK nuclease domain-containing protein [Candidatus Kapaibacterium sp.]|nr:PDDEXK nuclease domain-containing protein [Bacteroidota bacterium]
MKAQESHSTLYQDIYNLVQQARVHVAQSANKTLTLLYWQIGSRINKELPKGARATYGKQIVSQLATQLQEQFGKRGFQERNIRRMMQFALLFPDSEIVSRAATQLSWSHFIELISVKDELQREFYVTLAINQHWGRDTLRNSIDSMLYERSLISGKPDKHIKKELAGMRAGETFSPDVIFKSPYFLDFTGLKGMYSEKSLEDSLLISLEQFIMELGIGFAFVERQKRMIIDGEDFYLDLLFYHRTLQRLIAIELKLGKFKAAYKGQMELYLRWLDKNEKQQGEETPLGLILCAEGGHEQIELLQLEQAGIKVAEYLTELPDKKILQQKLHNELALRKQMQQHENED